MENIDKDTLKRIRRPDTVPIYSSNAYENTDKYGDGDIPPVDLPRNSVKSADKASASRKEQDEIDN